MNTSRGVKNINESAHESNEPSGKFSRFLLSRFGTCPAGWRPVSLGSLFTERSERSQNTDSIPLFSLLIGTGLTPKTERYNREFLLRDKEGNEYAVVHPKDIVFNPMNLRFGAVAMSRESKPVCVSAYYAVLAPTKAVDPIFLESYLASPQMIDLYDHVSIGSLIEKRRVHASILKSVEIYLPPLPEQKAIAAILSTWDRAIEQVTKLIEAKTRLKKGLMQQLLTGKRRFKEFKGKKWHTLKFSDFASQGKGLHDPRKDSTSFRCLELEHLSSGDGRVIGETESHVQLSIKRKFVEGDILFGKLRPYLRKYWTATFAGVCSTEIWVLRANKEYCIPNFLYSIVQTPEFEAGANKSFGSKMPRADWNVVSDLQFQLPGITEQVRISETMKLLDRDPEHLIALKDLMITQKQALMQVLLTGKVRVKTDDKVRSKGGKR